MDSTSLAHQYLGRQVLVRIDRPLGSRHPEHGFEYPVNYGYVPGVLAPDGDELDAYVLGVRTPLAEFCGHCIAIIHRRDDDDDKLVVVPEAIWLEEGEIRAQVRFQEQFFDSMVEMFRGDVSGQRFP
jgi:inorganic pyrophosphatase